MRPAKIISSEQRLRSNPDLVLREASLYFNQQGDLYKTLQDLAQRLDEAGIPYALVGDLALAQHGPVPACGLIRVRQLGEDLGEKLDASVPDMYAQLWREAQVTDTLSE